MSEQGAFAKVGEFAHLEVVSVSRVGAFLDWGLSKDLFLPFSEQTRDIKPGQFVVVYIYIDNTGRNCSTMRIEKFVDKDPGSLKAGDKVDLMIVGKTDLGFKAIINNKHIGMLYQNEVFEFLEYGQRLPGYVKRVRAQDGKIDLILQPEGYQAAGDVAEKIMSLLEEEGGFLAVNDKTSAEKIHDLFGVSRKKYKMALGGLYKRRLITVDEDGIRLNADKK